MISTPENHIKLPAELKRISDQFIMQLHKQLEVSVEEIENAIARFGRNRRAIEQYLEQQVVYDLQWKSFAWVRQWPSV